MIPFHHCDVEGPFLSMPCSHLGMPECGCGLISVAPPTDGGSRYLLGGRESAILTLGMLSLICFCSDVDECSDRADEDLLCDHFCHNYIGGFYCSCRYGYLLHSDNRTCRGEAEHTQPSVALNTNTAEWAGFSSHMITTLKN